MSKPLVLIVGATGNTGQAVAKAILQAGRFRLAILTRQQSAGKPEVKDLVAVGAELRLGDLSEPAEKLDASLHGVDILISTVRVTMIDQKPLFAAAKRVGVARVLPSEFAPIAPSNDVSSHDTKVEVREYIQSIDLPFTIVKAGWWLSALFPHPHSFPNTLLTPKYYIGDKNKKFLWSTLHTIGIFVAQIIDDPRTLNQTVVVHNGEISTEAIWNVSAKVSGEDFSDYYKASTKEIEATRLHSENPVKKTFAEFLYSGYIRGGSTLATAAAIGALDSRELYPELPYASVEEEAKKFYAAPTVLNIPYPKELLLDVFKPE